MKYASRLVWLGCLAWIVQGTQAQAQQHQSGAGEALQLLQKVATAAHKVTYSGVFVYQSGSRSETSRITHLIDGGNEFERLEVLDGSPREVMRRNDEVRCFLPDSRMLIVEQRNARPLFPTLRPGALAGLTEYYDVRKGAMARVAGVESQSIQIDPRDEFRYGHQFWIDPQTGLLLKASLLVAAQGAVARFSPCFGDQAAVARRCAGRLATDLFGWSGLDFGVYRARC